MTRNSNSEDILTPVYPAMDEATDTLPHLAAGITELRAAAHLIDAGADDPVMLRDATEAVDSLLLLSEQLLLSLRQTRARLSSAEHRFNRRAMEVRRARKGLVTI